MNERIHMQNIEMTKGSMSTSHETLCKFGIRCYNYILIFYKSDSLTENDIKIMCTFKQIFYHHCHT